MNIDVGLQLERRAHRLAWHLGYLVRRRVCIFSHEKTSHKVTDIDVIGIRFDKTFNSQTMLIETKHERGFASLLKLKGMLAHYPSSIAYLIRPNITPDLAKFAQTLGIRAMHTSRLDEIESELGINPNDWSLSYSPEFDKTFSMSLRRLRELGYYKEVYFRDFFWFERDPFFRLKLLKDFLLNLHTKGKERNVTTYSPTDYLIMDLSVLFSVALLEAVGALYSLPEHQRSVVFREKLISGKLSLREKEEFLSKLFTFLEKYTKNVLKEAMPLKREHLELLPSYANSLYDLMVRLMKKPQSATLLPRIFDAYLASAVLGKTPSLPEIKKFVTIPDTDFEHASKFCKDMVQFIFEEKELPHAFSPLFVNANE